VYDPVAVAAPTAIVIVDDDPAVTDAGLNETAVPAGAPDELSETDCAAPLVTAVEIVTVPFEPCATLTDVGLAEIEKSDGGAAVTVSVTVVVCVALEPVPVTVIGYVPGAVAAPTDTVIVDEPPAETVTGLNETVVPAGCPLALRVTLCDEPLTTAVEIVDVPLPPCTTLSDAGLADIVKSDGPVAPQPANLNDASRVCQLKLPFDARYWFVYQNVQSSTGSTLRLV
jgi:hypothetical protein